MTTKCTKPFAVTDFGHQLVYDGTSWSRAFQLGPATVGEVNVACTEPSFCMFVEANGFQAGS